MVEIKRSFWILWLFALPIAALEPVRSAEDLTSIEAAIATFLQTNEEAYIELRRDLHRNPELADAEVRTAKIVADRLEAAGLRVRREVGGHGVVAVLQGALPGGIVAYRADMDAARSSGDDPVEFASVRPGVGHVCGHDIHTTVGVAIAEATASQRERIGGTLIFLFQGAEETASGAQRMLADGAFEGLDPTDVLALHTSPLAAGTLGLVEGPMLAGRSGLSIRFGRAGGRAAVLAALNDAGRLLTRQDLPSVELTDDLCGFLVETEGRGRMEVRVYFASEPGRLACKERTLERFQKLAESSVEWRETLSSGVWSHPEVVQIARGAIVRALGNDGAVESGPAPPLFSEDFGFLLDGRKGAMFWLGVGPLGRPHSPGYVADERSIAAGARAMSAALLDLLASEASRNSAEL